MNVQILALHPLNSGGYGDVFVGRRSDTGERVVVKFLREAHLAHARKAFEREVRILRRGLRGLMPLLSADLRSKRPYYVMPYLDRGPLSPYAGRLTDAQLYGIAKELALTLATLHSRSIAHGDFKPDNILVNQDGRLQVADPLGNGMGCTMLFSQNHGGTPGYWAPEVRAGGPISYSGDVYSYGATLYELLTGRRPQDGRRLDPTSEGYVNAPIVRQLIAACCNFNPLARPTIQEVLRVLSGEQWPDIQAARKQTQERVTAAFFIGSLLLLGFTLAN